jgi:hypothetical protein
MGAVTAGVSSQHFPSPRSQLTSLAGWYIPPSWTDHIDDPIDNELNLRGPQTPTEAATLALGLAMRKDRFLSNTKIPLIIHQTWKSLDSHTWSDLVRESVNQWLEVAVGGDGPETPPAAYIMWDDKGVEEFMKVYENSSWTAIQMMPYKVERADVFRVAVLKWFGGVVSIGEVGFVLISLTHGSMQTLTRSRSSIPRNGSKERTSVLGPTQPPEPNTPCTNRA